MMSKPLNRAELLDRFGDRLHWKTLTRGQVLFHRGDPAAATFVVGYGRLRLIRHVPGIGEVTYFVARDGDTLAEAALFSETYHCDAVADVDSKVAVIPREVFFEETSRDPALMRSFVELLAVQVRDARQRFQLRSVRPAKERVWQYLLLSARGTDVSLDGPLHAAATELGLTREALYRALSELKADGRIAGQGRRLRLTKDKIDET